MASLHISWQFPELYLNISGKMELLYNVLNIGTKLKYNYDYGIKDLIRISMCECVDHFIEVKSARLI